MCFLITNKKVQTATEDIICWKEVERGEKIFSPYRRFVYKKGKVYTRGCLRKKEYKMFNVLNIGFHSYIVRKDILRFIDEWSVVKFIIPKGARYLINDFNEYISNQIIMK